MNSLLNPSELTTGPHTADDFARYFTDKVDANRVNTSGAPLPTVTRRLVPPLSSFDSVTVEEISNIIRKAPSKQCDLDLVPTWLVKTCCDLLAPTITEMVTMCLQQGIFLDSHKHALVRPRLKKPLLDPLEFKSI